MPLYPEGKQGQGPAGAPGGSSSAFPYRFSSATTAPPGTGQIRRNTADLATTTAVYLSYSTPAGNSVLPWLRNVATGDRLVLQDTVSPSQWAEYTATADAVDVPGGQYVSVAVVYAEGAGGPTQDGGDLTVFYTPVGPRGIQGVKGDRGVEGVPGPKGDGNVVDAPYSVVLYRGAVPRDPAANVWVARTIPNAMSAVTYGNGVFVAIPYGASVTNAATSPDGITWTTRTMPSAQTWNSVAYGAGLFVAVASSGTGDIAATSPDGITWTQRTLPTAGQSWAYVAYGNGLFVAMTSGTSNTATSPDGITWTARTGTGGTSMCFSNGMFIVTYNSNSMGYSLDGINWLSASLPQSLAWACGSYGNGALVVIASGTTTAYSSPDGFTFTARTVTSNTWKSVVFAQNMFVLAGSSAGSTSPDGATWTTKSIGAGTNPSIAYGNGIFVTVASGSAVASSCHLPISITVPPWPVTVMNTVLTNTTNAAVTSVSVDIDNVRIYSGTVPAYGVVSVPVKQLLTPPSPPITASSIQARASSDGLVMTVSGVKA